MAAARALPQLDPGLALRHLMEAVQKPDFKDLPDREQAAFLTGLAMTSAVEVFEYLHRQLQSSTLLGRKRLTEFKRNIVTAVGAAGTPDAQAFLEQELPVLREAEVRAAAERALARLQSRSGPSMHGKPAEPPPEDPA
jgi:hypothetical protein